MSDQPSRFHANPAQVGGWLREHFAEDVLLRFQRAIGGRAVGQAAAEQRLESARRGVTGAPLPEYIQRGWRDAADHVDPLKGGGPWPPTLINLTLAAPHLSGADAEFPATWSGGHALVVEYGDCELHGRCQCGKRLGMVTPDTPLDSFAAAWERHAMGGEPS